MNIIRGINMENEGEKIVDSVVDSMIESTDDEARNIKKARKKNKRKTVMYLVFYFGVFLIPVVLLVAYLRNGVAGRQHEIKEIVYEEDYASIYSEELKIVFGPDCKVGDKKDIIIEGESCSCGYHQDTLIYDEWEITYKDQYGQTFVQTMNNMKSFEEQQIEWLTNQLEEHYRANQLGEYFDPETLEGYQPVDAYGRNYVYVWYGNPVNSYSTDEEKKEMETAEKEGKAYDKELMEKLSSSENMIRLYELDYSRVYSTYPLRIIVNLADGEEGISPEQAVEYRQIYEEKMDEIVANIMEEAGGICNLEFEIDILYGEVIEGEIDDSNNYEFSYHRSIIGGEEVDFGDYDKSYDQLLYYWYNENIW